MDPGDIAVAVRFLERASKTRDKQQLTFINKRSTPPVLINASALRVILKEKQGIRKVNALADVHTEEQQTRGSASRAAETVTEWLVSGGKEAECLKKCHRDVVQ